MKALSSQIIRRLGCARLPVLALLAAACLPMCARATDDFWINTGFINFAPQIDATNFVNSGQMTIATRLPFETSNTRNFTNSGTMTGQVGWLLDYSPSNAGQRGLADNIVNLNTGTIQGLDGGGVITTNGVGQGAINLFPSYVWLSASNIVNKGLLSVGGNGWMKLVGTNVNVSRSALEVTGINPHGSVNFSPTQTNFIPDVAIQDIYWWSSNSLSTTPNLPYQFNTRSIWSGTVATTPPFEVESVPGFVGLTPQRFSIIPTFSDTFSNISPPQVSLTLTNADGSTTNLIVPTNIVKQAVFVSVSDPSKLSVAASWDPSPTFGNPYQTICVQLAMTTVDVITGNPTVNTLYFYDTFASLTNRGQLVNVDNPALPPFVFQRPVNYLLSRIDDGRFAAGVPGQGPPDAAYLYDPTTFSSIVATGEFAAYHAFVDNLVTEPPALAAGTATNFPGRVQVYADNLDFRQTRVRGEGEVVLHANHLLSSEGAAVDCQNLSYFLASTNGLLTVTNLAQTSVTRLRGDLVAYSALWTNQMVMIFTNNYSVSNTVDTNGVITGTNAISVPLTNIANVGIHVLLLDANALLTQLPVITWDLVNQSTNIVIDDNLAVVQTLILDGQSVTLNGGLTLSNTTVRSVLGASFNFALNDWVATNAPSLLYFTNNGTFIVPSEAHFGDDRPIPYTDFINAGTLRAGSINIDSSFMQNSGLMAASIGPLDLVGNMGLFQNGQSTSGGDIDFSLSDLKFNNHQLSAVGTINFTVSDGLSDAGPSSANVFRMQNGFNLFVKPTNGDFLGTAFQDSPRNFIEVDHVWAGADRGVSKAGYLNNCAIGKLVLSAQGTSPANAPLFFFKGANGQNGLYADLLDISSLGSNYLALIEIDPSLTIYYAAANVGFSPPPNPAGIPQEPEEFLDGQFGGHLRWVSTFAGPNSSVDVIINGVTVAVNRALRFSKIIDSNGNGIPNFYDPFPFNSIPLVLTASMSPNNQPANGSVAVSWNAAPLTSYQVEFTADIENPNWQPLTRYTNTGVTNAAVTVLDPNAPTGTHRFYRVKTAP